MNSLCNGEYISKAIGISNIKSYAKLNENGEFRLVVIETSAKENLSKLNVQKFLSVYEGGMELEHKYTRSTKLYRMAPKISSKAH